MKKYLLKIAIVLPLLLLSAALAAQCPMCRMSAESNLQNGGTAGLGLNAGILYMLVMPYLLVAAIGFWWWKNRRKDADVNASFEETDGDYAKWN